MSRSGYLRIDVQEVLDELDDDDLLDELQNRRLVPACPGETCDLDIVREAHAALQCNQVIEARCILERLIFPKWKSVGKCSEQYAQLKLTK